MYRATGRVLGEGVQPPQRRRSWYVVVASNGTYVHDKPVDMIILKAGDRIRFGATLKMTIKPA